MKIFIVCPVRKISDLLKSTIEAKILELENAGYLVYYPARDTEQNDPTGYSICATNREAIRDADEILIAWDGSSEGVLFDIGMAFMMGKAIKIIEPFPPKTEGKSFASMIREWAR